VSDNNWRSIGTFGAHKAAWLVAALAHLGIEAKAPVLNARTGHRTLTVRETDALDAHPLVAAIEQDDDNDPKFADTATRLQRKVIKGPDMLPYYQALDFCDPLYERKVNCWIVIGPGKATVYWQDWTAEVSATDDTNWSDDGVNYSDDPPSQLLGQYIARDEDIVPLWGQEWR
jgi:hypothetical protein